MHTNNIVWMTVYPSKETPAVHFGDTSSQSNSLNMVLDFLHCMQGEEERKRRN